jgi:hypothetical protein
LQRSLQNGRHFSAAECRRQNVQIVAGSTVVTSLLYPAGKTGPITRRRPQLDPPANLKGEIRRQMTYRTVIQKGLVLLSDLVNNLPFHDN